MSKLMAKHGEWREELANATKEAEPRSLSAACEATVIMGGSVS